MSENEKPKIPQKPPALPERYVFGRPAKYKKAYCRELVEHMDYGYSFESFAAKINTCKKTLYNWAEKYPDFLHAKKIGTEKARLFWERLGVKGATGQIGFNATAWIFNMKNRFYDEWKDRQDIQQNIEITAEMRLAALYAQMTPQQRVERYQEAVKLEKMAIDAKLIAQGAKELPDDDEEET